MRVRKRVRNKRVRRNPVVRTAAIARMRTVKMEVRRVALQSLVKMKVNVMRRVKVKMVQTTAKMSLRRRRRQAF